MDKDPRTAAAHETWVALVRDLIRRRKWTYALFFGATGGMAVGVLNLVAVTHKWQKLEDTFEVLNLPVTPLIDAIEHRFSYLAGPSWAQAYTLGWLVIICYWMLIGLFAASVFCLAGDWKCRRTLLFGAGAGILVGCLNVLVIVNRWSGLERNFDFLDRPAYRALNAIYERIQSWQTIEGLHKFPMSDFLYSRLTYVAYWMTIGLLAALVFCAIQILRKRKAAACKQVSAECFSEE